MDKEKEYDAKDKSNQGLLFENEYFPAYFRLFRYNFLDLCLMKTSNSVFNMFTDIIGKEKLRIYVEVLRDAEKVLYSVNPDMGVPPLKVDSEEDQEKYDRLIDLRKSLIVTRLKDEAVRMRNRVSEVFLNSVFYNEKGLRAADLAVFCYDPEFYKILHMSDIPEEWRAITKRFFDKFYYPADHENYPKQRCGVQLLDRVAAIFDGEKVKNYWEERQKKDELACMCVVFDDQNMSTFKTDVIHDILHPDFYYPDQERKRGIEDKMRLWNKAKSMWLLACLPYISSDDNDDPYKGYYSTIEAMSKDPTNRAALFYLQRDYRDVLAERDLKVQMERQRQIMGENENDKEAMIDLQNAVKKLRPQPPSSIEQAYNDDEEKKMGEELKLRSYQEELVQPALRGENVVIVAPTGSGKTEVGIYAALRHMEKREEQKLGFRVVMLVPKIPLVKQQSERFQKYCFGRYLVDGFHGSENTHGKGRKDDVLKAHICVMTPQILVNMLTSVRQNERLYVCDFSMIIIDEVHKTNGEHAYTKVAEMVRNYDGDKPQMVGLTASLNIGSADNPDMKRMLDEIYRLLAILDAPCLSSIQNPNNLAELEQHVPKPDDEVLFCKLPETARAPVRSFIDRYIQHLHKMFLEELQRFAHNNRLNTQGFTSTYFRNAQRMRPDRDHARYDQFINQAISMLQKCAGHDKLVPNVNALYLRAATEARNIALVMPASVAFNYLDEQIQELGKYQNLRQFSDHYHKSRSALMQSVQINDNDDPTIVTELKKELLAQFNSDPNSRAIVFVEQRATAVRVCEFLNAQNLLTTPGGVPTIGYLLGTTNTSSTMRQSSSDQQMVIQRFRSGKIKVLVSTSVVEEGLDVAACNLIIKYNCSGSAIQLMQRRGRARARGSRSVLLVSSASVKDQENNALLAEKRMRTCIQIIQKNGSRYLNERVEEMKRSMKRAREMQDQEREVRDKDMMNKTYVLRCSACSKMLCESTHIKKFYSNYVACDPTIWDRLELNIEKKWKKSKRIDAEMMVLCDIRCKCQATKGKAIKYGGVYLPQLSLGSHTDGIMFVEKLQNGKDGETRLCVKWSTVEEELFYVAPAADSHYIAMLNAMPSQLKANMEVLSHELMTEIERNTREEEARERARAEARKLEKVEWLEAGEDEDAEE